MTCALLAGGGLRAGQIVGATTRLGEAVKERPVHFLEVMATLYRHAGLDAGETFLHDLSGRPHCLVGGYRPIAELT